MSTLTNIPSSDLLVELSKRRIGWPGATPASGDETDREPTAGTRMTEQEIQEKEAEWAKLGVQLEADLKQMKADRATPPALIHGHEQAIGKLHNAYVALRQPDDISADEARRAHDAASQGPGLANALHKSEVIAKRDGVTSAEAFRQQMRDPGVAAEYAREMGTAPPVSFARPAGLVKGESRSSHGDAASVAEHAQQLMKSEGLDATAAFGRAMAESGVYSGAAA